MESGVLSLMTSWQPIETAPKDGTPILAYCQKEREWPFLIVEWSFGSWFVHGNEIYGESTGIDPKPTHWMPLPEPPND
jgi:hypothetical protein